MTTLENFYFGNVNPSEYRQSKETKKKISEMTELLDELKDLSVTISRLISFALSSVSFISFSSLL